jgi:hypothetical protein
MKFQKGNKLWQNVDPEKVGCPCNFKTPLELWEKCCEYFKYVDENPFVIKEKTTYDKESEKGQQEKVTNKPRPYTWDALYVFLNVSDIDNYRKNKAEFFGITNKIEKIIRTNKFEGAASGLFNANIIARELGLKEHTDHTTQGEKLQTQFIVTSQEIADEAKNFIDDVKKEK